MNAGHRPVMCSESIEFLVQEESRDGIFVDATFGRGGHSKHLLTFLGGKSKLIALDKDLEAFTAAKTLAKQDARLVPCHGSFSDIKRHLADIGVKQVDGILMDLGVSSPQLENPERGFSFSINGPLDMRMDQSSSPTAAEWLNEAAVGEISEVLKTYGEERYANGIARAIVRAKPLENTADLVAAVAKGIKRSTTGKHFATRTFQAVRIKINNELDDLEKGLVDGFDVLGLRGRLVVISFHSLEDRIVKNFFKGLTQSTPLPRRLPIRNENTANLAMSISRRSRASVEECRKNPRARSAVLRAVERRQ